MGNVAEARALRAHVVAFDMPLMWNRLGAQNINGMIYALRRDTVVLNSTIGAVTGNPIGANTPLSMVHDDDLGGLKGNVTLRPDKRPRPLVLRMGERDTLEITLTNLLAPGANPFNVPNERSGIPFELFNNNQVEERAVSLRFMGTELVNDISDDGSNVGVNVSSLVDVGGTDTFTIRGTHDGTFVGRSMGVTFGGEGLGGTTASGLFAILNVNPAGSAFYRSQLTREEMDIATDGPTASGHPVIDYEATYPYGEPWESEGKAGLPIINMVTPAGEIVHSDINAIVAHGGADFEFDGNGWFPPDAYPLERAGKRNPTVPNRLQPFREFTIAFHDEAQTEQAFPGFFEDPVMSHTLHGVRDSFMINYGSGGIGSEIIANRLGVGPMHDCVNCAYEEFFLTAFTVGDVGMLVDIPANAGLEQCAPGPEGNMPANLQNCGDTGPKATFALYPDDPSNVHHGYTGDATAFRNLHAGPGEQHVFHLHNHQWLFNANDDNSNYLDAQGLGPGSGYAYWVNFGGAGNRNKTAGDAIFHCHFYPHFAQGMWEMWRIHDVFEIGTELAAQAATVDDDGDGTPDRRTSFVENGLGIGNGMPAAGARALPDGEIVAGTPIPAVVPLPGRPMAPMPAEGVTVKANAVEKPPAPSHPDHGVATVPTGSLAEIPDRTKNPGYPFWIAGIEDTVGQRPTTPPLDMLTQVQAGTLAASEKLLWSHPGLASSGAVHGWDGGLPRFTLEGYAAGSTSLETQNRLDFTKEITKAKPVFYPEEGTDLEQVAMAYHAQRCHDTAFPDGSDALCSSDTGPDGGPNGFILNGAPPVPGAPYNEPCIDDQGDLLSADVIGDFFSGSSYDHPVLGSGGLDTKGSSPFDAENPRVYKAANVQFDAVFNKLGYHYPQQRIITLWQDVVPTILKERPPEPLVLRMNTFDCTQYVHSNVVPKTFELDDYQVRTPTDIIGQHIHLPKWDLVSADGAANGWNYEDGTLAPDMVREIIEAINRWNTEDSDNDSLPDNPQVLTLNDGITPVRDSLFVTSGGTDGSELSAAHPELHPTDHPFFGTTQFAERWKGARSTMQRWFADPVVNVQGVDRGLGIIFTHDHYGPSTHQQIGLYATVLIEPATSKWYHNETGEELYTRTGAAAFADGGPTSWQAAIIPGRITYTGQNVGGEKVEQHREFFYEYSDFQHAYQPGVYIGANDLGQPENTHTEDFIDTNGDGIPDTAVDNGYRGDPDAFRDAIQPSVRLQASTVNGYPVDIWKFPPECPGGVLRPCAEAISADDPGMYVVNYRNESLAARVYDPNRPAGECPDGNPGCQATGDRGDLAFAMQSRTDRAWSLLNVQPTEATSINGTSFPPPINQIAALDPGDPFTSMMRAFDGDRVHVKVQAGAHEEEHTFMVHGVKWLQGGSGFGEGKNTGWRNAQAGGISEQFSFRTPVLADEKQAGKRADYAYSSNASLDGWVSGTWGIMRSYGSYRSDLFELPANNRLINITNRDEFEGVCPIEPVPGKKKQQQIANLREYDVVAVLAEDVLWRDNPLIGDASGHMVDPYPGAHAGRSPDPAGGTLVYNSRPDAIGATDAGTGGGYGPLHDPTAILYVHAGELLYDPAGVRTGYGDPVGFDRDENGVADTDPWIEPLVIRANAGDCIRVTLHNALLAQATHVLGDVIDAAGNPAFMDGGQALFVDQNGDGIGENQACPPGSNLDTDSLSLTFNQCVFADATTVDPTDEQVPASDVTFDEMPDLAHGNAIPAMVRRDRNSAEGMTSFNNNLMAPSPHVGLHAALVEYDVSRDDGTAVGLNPPGQTLARPGEKKTYQWYAGDIGYKPSSGPKSKRNIELVPTPIEFGGFNLMPADKIEQGQKGMVGAGVIYPQGWSWEVDPGSYTIATLDAGTAGTTADDVRDFTVVTQKGATMFYADTHPLENILGEGSFGVAEDAQDMGHMAINYGAEPLWYRFGVNPTDDEGLHTVSNGTARLAYRDDLVGSPPETALFTADAGQEFRMHVLMPFGPGRGSTFDLHGHVWLRDPYICPGSNDGLGPTLEGKCNMGNGHAGSAGTGEVGSKNLGVNPIGFALGGIESWFPGQHYEIYIPSAGGSTPVSGDYLFRDHMGLGNVQGLWGIIQVGNSPRDEE